MGGAALWRCNLRSRARGRGRDPRRRRAASRCDVPRRRRPFVAARPVLRAAPADAARARRAAPGSEVSAVLAPMRSSRFHAKGERQAGISAGPGRQFAGVVHRGRRPDRVDAGPGGYRRHPVTTAILARSLDRPERADTDNGVPAARRRPISAGGDVSRDHTEHRAATAVPILEFDAAALWSVQQRFVVAAPQRPGPRRNRRADAVVLTAE